MPQHFRSERDKAPARWTLTHAPIFPAVRSRILVELKNEFANEPGFRSGDSTVSFARLNSEGRVAVLVVTPKGTCGATGNCDVWLFDDETGALLVQENGWDYGFRKTSHHGVFDFYMRANMSCCSGTRHEYRFDGEVYKLAQDVNEAYK